MNRLRSSSVGSKRKKKKQERQQVKTESGRGRKSSSRSGNSSRLSKAVATLKPNKLKKNASKTSTTTSNTTATSTSSNYNLNHYPTENGFGTNEAFNRSSQYPEPVYGSGNEALVITGEDSYFSRMTNIMENNNAVLPPQAYHNNNLPFMSRNDSYVGQASTESPFETRDPPFINNNNNNSGAFLPLDIPVPLSRSRSHDVYTSSNGTAAAAAYNNTSQNINGGYMPHSYGLQQNTHSINIFNSDSSFDSSASWLTGEEDNEEEQSGDDLSCITMPTTGYEHQLHHHAHRTRAHSTVSIHNDDSSCGDLSVGYDFQRTNSMPNMSYDHHPHQRNSLTDNEEEEEEDANPEISQIKHERRVKAGILRLPRGGVTLQMAEQESKLRATDMFSEFELREDKQDSLNKRADFRVKGREYKSTSALSFVSRKQKMESLIKKQETAATQKAEKIIDHPFLTEGEKERYFKRTINKFRKAETQKGNKKEKRGSKNRRKKKNDRNLSNLADHDEGMVIYGSETIEVVPTTPSTRKPSLLRASTIGSMIPSKGKRAAVARRRNTTERSQSYSEHHHHQHHSSTFVM